MNDLEYKIMLVLTNIPPLFAWLVGLFLAVCVAYPIFYQIWRRRNRDDR